VDARPFLPSGIAVPVAVQGRSRLHVPVRHSYQRHVRQRPGPVVAANQIYAGVLPSLGRPFFAGQSQVNVVEPGTVYGDRLNQIDLRFSKLVNLGGGRVDLNVDLYNAFNTDAILTQQNLYGATWTRRCR
jgi:hypothetical protein